MIACVGGGSNAIGFGISTPQQARKMVEFSNGVIVGSAIIKLLEEHGRDAAEYVGDYVQEIKVALLECKCGLVKN